MAAYGFDEGSGATTADASGNGNTGTASNTTWADTGKFGKALDFNGTNSRVTIPDSASLHLSNAFTLEAWVNPSSVSSAWRDIIEKGNDNYYLMATSDTLGRPIGGAIVGGTYGEAVGTASLATGTWTHLAATYDGAALRLYVNGTLTATTPKTGSVAVSTSALTIGSDPFYGQYFSGSVDEIRIYDAALSQTQIQTDMATAVAAGPDEQAPSAPGTLSATAASSARVALSWGAASDNVGVTGYEIERCQGQGCSGFTQIATTNGTTTSYDDTSVGGSTVYTYRVRAVDGTGNLGPYGTTATATTPTSDTTPPTAPGGLAATAVSANRIDLSWNAATDNAAVNGYRIERCSGAGCTSFAQIAAPAGTGTTYADGTVNAATAYSYRVRATDAAGNIGPYGNTAGATTPAGPSGLMAAYGFDEGSGTTVADASGNGNTGTAANTTWAATGKFGKALTFNGTSSRVTVPDSASLHLTSAFTLEAWVNPTTVSSAWRDIIEKGNDNYYLMATSESLGRPAAGAILGGSSGQASGSSNLATGTWTHLAATYDGSALRLYVNGVLAATTPKSGAVAVSTNALTLGSDPFYGQYLTGSIDEVRIYNTALGQAQIQTDMATAVSGGGSTDHTPPTVAITSPAAGAQVNDIVNVTADASDDNGVAGVQFLVDGVATGLEDSSAPYGLSWDTRTVSNGAHTLTAIARDGGGNTTVSTAVAVNVANVSSFQNETLATGFALPTSIDFLPDGRMLVVELAGTIEVLPPPYTQADPTPFLQLTNIGSAGVQQGIYDIALDPDFANNHYYYLFYTLGSPNRDRLSRFTANASLTGTIAGSETVLYQDGSDANAEHHGGAIAFGNDGKLYFTTGEHFDAAVAQSLSSPRGKIHRINKDGTIPTDNPFYDGNGPNVDSIWARGLRNPFRAYYDVPTGRLIIGDVGGNDYSTAEEEVDVGAAGANYAWPNCEGICGAPYTDPIYAYAHNGRDAAITGGFVYHGSQFPSSYEGSYFFADYTQNWIKRLTFDANGKVDGVYNFEPADGSVDGPYGDIVYLTQGPDGALYYVDLGYSDIGGTFGVSKIRRIRYVQSDQAPVAAAAANPTSGAPPLDVAFSSAGSLDPEGRPLTYSWTFGDGSTSTAANPTHTYTQPGKYTARLSVSDGVNTTLSTPIVVSVGHTPTATILTPQDGATFRAGDVISFSGDGNDLDDGSLPASAYTWNIDFLHEGHVHPGIAQTGIRSGSFTIPTSGHDFSGNTRYRITLTVTDSDGLTASTSVLVYPQKVNLSFATTPPGLTLYLDGIAKVTPFVYDTLIGFNHTIEARNQSSGGTGYTFGSWSDGGAQQHTLVVPATDRSYTAAYNAVIPPATPTFVQVRSSVPQTPQTTVATAFGQPQGAGNLNVVVIGWNNSTSNIVSVTDSAGNAYQVAAPTTRRGTISQAVYYAKNIAGGANTVTVTFNTATPYVDVRAAEYAGIDRTNPLDVTASSSGTSASPSSGAATTGTPKELLVGAGTTTATFTGAGTGYTTRVITSPDGDILEDRAVTATGSYSATAAHRSGTWVMQLVTFRAAGQ